MPTSDDELPPTVPAGAGPGTEPTRADDGRTPAAAPPPLSGDWREDPDIEAVESLGRFRIEGFLGAGGMGKVFRALDRELDRPVALKVLTLADAAATRRFVAEARAQARVDHPNVCKVFDAGEVRGRRYIVMQLLEGRTLSRLARELTLEQKIAIVRDVCEGVQAAHRIGLVHRDLKASNVIVVSGDEGHHPFVLDFGIAREIGAGGTVTEGAAGTPWYMSPEQVAGESVDRRSDVYSLGVLLYRLLADRYPIEGSSEVDVLLKVLTEDPAPLGRVAPRVPADLDTIVMKCLERDPSRRYDSARALALDLARWLAGEPIEARPAGVLYRLGKRVRKHRALVAIGAAAAIAVAVGAGLALRERFLASERARIAQRFGAESERLEWMLRAAYELPLHDVSPVRATVRQHLAELEGRLATVGSALETPARLALGRGYLALDEEERALDHLERAWAAGDRDPDLAYARGLALARRLERAVAAARQIASEPERRAALEEARRRWREPARAALERAQGALGAPGQYVEALLALLDGQLRRALTAAREVVPSVPWFYEAQLLEASIHREAAALATEPAERSAALDRAERALAAAARAGESDPRVHESICSLGFERMTDAISGHGEEIEGRFEAATRACDRALEADPAFAPARRTRLGGIAAFASWELDRGRDPSARLAGAMAEAEKLIAESPDEAESRLALARLRLVEAKRLRFSGGDPRAVLTSAIGDLEAARERGADGWRTAADLGKAHADLAIQIEERGEDPERARDRSIAELERATELAPELFTVHFDLARTWSDRAARLQQRNSDPTFAEERAIAGFRRALAIKPDYPQAENSLGVVHLNRGQQRVDRGEAAGRDELEEAIRHFQRANEIQPDYANSRFNLGLAWRALAAADALQGRDPWPALDRAAEAFRAGLEINPGIFFAWLEMGRIYTQGAEWNVEHDRAPDAALAEAHRLVDRSLEAAPEDFMALFVKGEAELLAARWSRRRGRAPGPALERSRGWLERAERANPESLATLQLVAELELEQAEALAATRRPHAEELARAHEAIARAAAIHADLPALGPLRERLAALESGPGAERSDTGSD